MCEFLKFNAQKRHEKQKFWQLFGNFLKKIATFWQLLDTFIGNFLGIHRQLVAKPRYVWTGPKFAFYGKRKQAKTKSYFPF